MKWPFGDILRAIFPNWKWLQATKGISIKKGDTEILLSHEDRIGASRPGESPLDRTPSRPKPDFGGRRR